MNNFSKMIFIGYLMRLFLASEYNLITKPNDNGDKDNLIRAHFIWEVTLGMVQM